MQFNTTTVTQQQQSLTVANTSASVTITTTHLEQMEARIQKAEKGVSELKQDVDRHSSYLPAEIYPARPPAIIDGGQQRQLISPEQLPANTAARDAYFLRQLALQNQQIHDLTIAHLQSQQVNQELSLKVDQLQRNDKRDNSRCVMQ